MAASTARGGVEAAGDERKDGVHARRRPTPTPASTERGGGVEVAGDERKEASA